MDADLLRVVEAESTLCLNVSEPGWDDARGYVFDPQTKTLYFPVAAKYLAGRDPEHFEVLIWSQPRVLVVGRLAAARSDVDIDTALGVALAVGMDPSKAN